MIAVRIAPLILATLLGLAACSGGGSTPTAANDGGGPAEADAEAGISSQGDGGSDGGEGGRTDSDPTPSFRVALQSEDVELCQGECTTLTAVVEHARGEVEIDWEQDLSGEGPHEICPTETTRYTVEATDVLEVGEFSSETQAGDQRTVSVVSCEPESPVVCEARYRSSFPGDGNVLRTELAWVNAYTSDSALTRGPNGSMYLMGAYGSRLDLGADVLDADSTMHGFVHKLDDDCEPLWTRRLDPSVDGDVVLPAAVTSDDEGNVYAVSTSGPLLDFDPLLPFPFRFATEIVVYAFSADGEERYRRTLPMALGGAVHDVIADADGRLYMTGFANALSDFGGGPLGVSPTTLHAFLLALDADGRHLATETGTGAYRLSRAADSVVFVGNALDSVDVLASLLGFFPTSTQEPAMVSRHLPSLNENWRHPLDQRELWPSSLEGHADGSSVAVGQESLFEEDEDTLTIGSILHLMRYDESGAPADPVEVLRMSRTIPRDEEGTWYSSFIDHLATAPSGKALAFVGSYWGDVTLGDGSTLEGREEDDDSPFSNGELFVAKVGEDDALSWTRPLQVGFDPRALGLAMDEDGHVWAASQGRVDAALPGDQPYELDLVVTKLRAEP